jgi:hypothetical protein
MFASSLARRVLGRASTMSLRVAETSRVVPPRFAARPPPTMPVSTVRASVSTIQVARGGGVTLRAVNTASRTRGTRLNSTKKPGAQEELSEAAEAAEIDAKVASAEDAQRWGIMWPAIRLWRWSSLKMQSLWRRYGWLTVVTWFGVYFTFLGTVFGIRRLGLFGSVGTQRARDLEEWINKQPWKQRWLGERPISLSPAAFDFMVAWLLIKPTEPLRLILVVLLVPWLVRRLPPSVLLRLGAKIPPK